MTTTPTAPKCPFPLPVRVDENDPWSRHQYVLRDAKGQCFAEVLGDDIERAEWLREAIEAHTTLTAEVARLREALERQKVIHAKIALAATHDGLKEFAKAALAEVENISTALRGVA